MAFESKINITENIKARAFVVTRSEFEKKTSCSNSSSIFEMIYLSDSEIGIRINNLGKLYEIMIVPSWSDSNKIIDSTLKLSEAISIRNPTLEKHDLSVKTYRLVMDAYTKYFESIMVSARTKTRR